MIFNFFEKTDYKVNLFFSKFQKYMLLYLGFLPIS